MVWACDKMRENKSNSYENEYWRKKRKSKTENEIVGYY